MFTLLLLLVVAVAVGVVFIMMKNGKIEDKDGNNIPDVLEKVVEDFKVEVAIVEDVVKKVTKK